MQRYSDNFIDSNGRPVKGAAVMVRTYPGNVPATLYSDNGVTTTPNPLTTDALGLFSFYAADGRYSLTITSDKTEPVTRTDFQLEDPTETPAVAKSELAADSGSSLVGFTPYGSGQLTPLVDHLTGKSVIKPTERGYWTDVGAGANIHRMRDRLFVGGGVVSSGAKIQGNNETWLTGDMGAYWFERGAQTLSLSTYGQFGGVFASRTSGQDLHNYGTAAIGVVGIANNDRTNGNGLAWGGYFEANRQAMVPAGAGTTYGVEVAVKNNNGDVVNGPYNRFPGGATVGVWLAGGGDPSYGGAGANPATAAVVIGKNGSTWNKGIVFDAAGITGTDGATGTGVAVSMAKGHVLEWQTPSSAQGATIRSDVTDTTKRTGLLFNNDQMWATAGGNLIGTIEKGGSTASYLRLISGGGGTPAQIKATSSETDADIYLNPQGSGAVRFGFHTASADAPIAGYIVIKDASGTLRKLAVIA